MKTLLILLAAACALSGQEASRPSTDGFSSAAHALRVELNERLHELSVLTDRIQNEKLPLSRQLGALETELSRVRQEYQAKARQVDNSSQRLSNLTFKLKEQQKEVSYLSTLLAQYAKEFEASLHIAEVHRYADVLEGASLAAQNKAFSKADVFKAQVSVLSASLRRLHEALGGATFEGNAVCSQGRVKKGRFLLVGPAALFRSDDGLEVGTVEQHLGSLEPSIASFTDASFSHAASHAVAAGSGSFPLDPTLGNAHKIARATQETLWDNMRRGGPVMVPIIAMALLVILIGSYKWLTFLFLRKPSKKRMAALLEAVGRQDHQEALQLARTLRGPAGKMLAMGSAQLGKPVEFIEEIMYETVLTTRLRLRRLLPFVSVCAASAPMLGLLGTVTGIINTFKMITVFGSGDVKSLSGGISEALITTKFGLIVAIPALLLHAFLSRKAKGLVGHMETAAMTFINKLKMSPSTHLDVPGQTEGISGESDLAPDLVRRQVNEILSEVLGVQFWKNLDEELLDAQVLGSKRVAPDNEGSAPQPLEPTCDRSALPLGSPDSCLDEAHG